MQVEGREFSINIYTYGYARLSGLVFIKFYRRRFLGSWGLTEVYVCEQYDRVSLRSI
jgi:hypothetical protein